MTPTPVSPRANGARPSTGFAALGVHHAQQRILDGLGITEPFPIQTATLPDSLAGRDVLGRGKTGSGKTLAFALPTVHRLAADRRKPQPGAPRALVLVPTRELANQVAETFAPLVKAAGLRLATVFGGVGQGPQVSALKSGVDVLVACPGRLEDLVGQGHCRLGAIEITVLDEADHMADMGFLPGVKRLLDRTPEGGQRLLFSATLDNGVDVLVRRYLSNPVVHSIEEPADAPVAQTHHVLTMALADKVGVVSRLAAGGGRTLLFTRTKHGAKKLVKQLATAGVPAVELHGNLSQNARERNLASFSAGDTPVLVATDIAARGIHVDEVRLVVHVDPPAEHKAFVHRSGRTARAGAEGVVVTLATPDQKRDVQDLARRAGVQPTWTAVDARHPLLAELAGPIVSHPTPLVPAAPPRQSPAAHGRPADRSRGNAPARSGGRHASSSRPAAVGRDGRAVDRDGRPAGSRAAGSRDGRGGDRDRASGGAKPNGQQRRNRQRSAAR